MAEFGLKILLGVERKYERVYQSEKEEILWGVLFVYLFCWAVHHHLASCLGHCTCVCHLPTQTIPDYSKSSAAFSRH